MAGKSGLTARPSRSAGTSASASAIIAGQELSRVNFQIDAQLHRAFKSRVAADGTTIKDVLTDYIERYLDGSE